ncbi:virion-associated phage protein [Burkholderia phage BcepIL02]|uniref:Virion-associated phage protein n=1 Tax=Burkholderia phage BcepIL02 TaxID=2886898 RepID=C5IHR0_9CAUD|nr:virion-associated phage protein [Burkholderia phage BcepIL02]ACR15061.1 virion-associated phage protein [Burkholderia phage BcepIL02]
MSDEDDGSGISSADIEASLERLRQQQLAQDEETARQREAIGKNSRPQSGGIGDFLNSVGKSMMNAQSFTPSSSGAVGGAGFAGASAPAIGAGTGEGATGLFGIGGMGEMAGGAGGSGLFTLGGASGGAGAGGAASSGIGGAVSAGGPYAAAAIAALAGRQYMINTDREKQSDILTGQGPVRHLGFLGEKIDKLPAGKPLGKQVAALGKMMSLRPSGFKDHIVASMPWNMIKDIF